MIKGLYIHIPFCQQICSYCDFSKMVANDDKKNKYIETLLEELDFYKSEYQELETIYIGGGTPSTLQLDLLEKLFIKIKDSINLDQIIEYTIECNPRDITEDFIKLIKKYSINRLSIGVQTINEKSLKILNRNHRISDIIEVLTLLRRNEFLNINLDFIYGIPNQTLADVLADLDFIKEYQPKHISYYSLILEDKTILSHQVKLGQIKLLDDDLIADFSDIIKQKLEEIGYLHYETSNYAFKGFESIHNKIYWQLEEYLGIGLNAASQYLNNRYQNQNRLKTYLKDFRIRNIEEFQPKLEYLLMGLRLIKGIDIVAFKQRFNQDIFIAYPILQKHLDNGLLVLEENQLAFSKTGQDLANQVYMDLL